jgi:hypothetical protein
MKGEQSPGTEFLILISFPMILLSFLLQPGKSITKQANNIISKIYLDITYTKLAQVLSDSVTCA